MIQIAPSILSADFLHLEKDVELVNREADLFHLDIMDGSFVPNISFGFPVVEAIAQKALGFPDGYLIPCFIGIGRPAPDAVLTKQINVDLDDRIHWQKF